MPGHALRDADRQAHAGEGTGPAAHCNRIQLAAADAGFGKQLLGPGQRQLRVPAWREFEALLHVPIDMQRDGAGFGGGFECEDFHGREP